MHFTRISYHERHKAAHNGLVSGQTRTVFNTLLKRIWFSFFFFNYWLPTHFWLIKAPNLLQFEFSFSSNVLTSNINVWRVKILIWRKKAIFNFRNYQPSKLEFISLWYQKTWTIITGRISLFGICFVLQPIVWPRPGKEKINRKSKRQQYCTYMLCTKRTSRNCTKFMIGWNAAACPPPPPRCCHSAHPAKLGIA